MVGFAGAQGRVLQGGAEGEQDREGTGKGLYNTWEGNRYKTKVQEREQEGKRKREQGTRYGRGSGEQEGAGK